MEGSRLLLSVFLATAAAWSPIGTPALALDPFLSPSPESSEEPGVVSITDDSFGPGPVKEWDDLDSFGLRVGMPVGRARLLAAISGLTDRTDAAADANRIDEASLGAACSVFSSASVRLSVAAGLDATGDFGGLLIQEGFHSATGVQRPVPTSYSGGFAPAPLGAFKLSVSSSQSWSPYLVIAGRGSIPARGSLLSVAGVRYARPGALVALGGGWRAVGGAAPCSTVAAVDAAENGPYLGFELRVGLLAFSFEDAPLLEKTNGSLGIVLGRPLRPPPGSTPIALDLGLLTGSSVAQRVRLTVGLKGNSEDLHSDAFFSFAQGWFASDHPDATQTFFAEYSAGGALSLPIANGPLYADLALGPYVSFERLSTETLASSTLLGYRDTLGLAVETGIHVALPIENAPLGLGWRFRWRALQTVALQTQENFPARVPFDFEIFFSSMD